MPRVAVKVLHKRTRKERREAHQGIALRDAGITIRTRRTYFMALSLLLPYIEDVQNESELDSACAEWVEVAWEDGEYIYTVGNALSGLHLFEPLTKRKIPSAWRLFATWKKLEWPARAYCALCHENLLFSCLLVLGFFTLLRTGELLKLKGRDLLINPRQLVVSLKETKTGKRNAADEMVTTDDPFALLIVDATRSLLADWNALDKPLCGFTGQAFRRHFDSYLRRFYIQNYGFRPSRCVEGARRGWYSRQAAWR